MLQDEVQGMALHDDGFPSFGLAEGEESGAAGWELRGRVASGARGPRGQNLSGHFMYGLKRVPYAKRGS